MTAAIAQTTQKECPKHLCDGSGWREVDRHGVTPCECRGEEVRRRRVAGLGRVIPRRYRHYSWDRPPLPQIAQENPPAVGDVRRYCDGIVENLDNGVGLWIQGTVGTGKTTLGYMIAQAAHQAGQTVISYTGPALMAKLRAAMYDENANATFDEMLGMLTAADLLHIEDLRVVRPSDWMLETLYMIVNERYDEQRSIVFTSDFEGDAPPLPPELGNHVGPRTFSRLFEICGDPVIVTGRDHRLDFRDVDGPGLS